MTYQASLLALGPPALADAPAWQRVSLDDRCWIDVCRGFLTGGDHLYEQLVATLPWQQGRRPMYERIVDEPRLTSGLSLGADGAAPPLLARCAAALRSRYGPPFTAIWCNWYRDGTDSVAWHADRIGREQVDPPVAVLSLGSARRFLLRPGVRGPSRSFTLTSGDLLVMGGSTQHRWQHSVPKMPGALGRISVTFRPPHASGARLVPGPASRPVRSD